MTSKAPKHFYQGKIGTVVPSSAFQGFSPGRVLVKYDRPLLQVMHSPRGESWLFNWLESNEDVDSDDLEDQDVEDTWIAFRVSETRLAAIEGDKVSLRDAILCSERQSYLVFGPNPLEPTQVRAVHDGELPKAGLPPGGFTIHGRETTSQLERTPAAGRVCFDFRLSSSAITMGELPFTISGSFHDRFQRWAYAAAHYAYNPVPKAVELAYPTGDWATLREKASATGSFKIEAVAQGKPFELDRLDEALGFLSRLIETRTESVKKDKLAKGIGQSGSIALFSLLHFVMLEKIDVELNWSYGESEGSIHIDPKIARSIAARLRPERAQIESNARLNIPLTPEDAAKIRLPVVGTGGLQDLLRSLNKGLSDDNVLSVNPGQIDRILRYSQRYGSGGFQSRLQGVLLEIKRLGASLSTLR
ncbi:MAG TPA: hypothetical protein VK424_01115 [Thermoplasmata archaeon]|nr:hypothetical protein [Thermoplasmata archaeon]